jgi:hypothetical protein
MAIIGYPARKIKDYLFDINSPICYNFVILMIENTVCMAISLQKGNIA